MNTKHYPPRSAQPSAAVAKHATECERGERHTARVRPGHTEYISKRGQNQPRDSAAKQIPKDDGVEDDKSLGSFNDDEDMPEDQDEHHELVTVDGECTPDEVPDYMAQAAAGARRAGQEAAKKATEEPTVTVAEVLDEYMHDPERYEMKRKGFARDLGIRVSYLDELVKRRAKEARDKALRAERTEAEARGDYSHLGLPYTPVAPYPEPVDGRETLDELVDVLSRYVIFERAEHALTVALWTMGTHVYQLFHIYPRLLITAPEKMSGKSRVLDCLEYVAARAAKGDNITGPAMFRAIEDHRVTLLIDEVDSFARRSETVRNILNSGFASNGRVFRVEGDGENRKTVSYSTFAPVAMAGIHGQSALGDTVLARSLMVTLTRKLRSQEAKPFLLNTLDDLRLTARKLTRWAADEKPRLAHDLTRDPALPDFITDRQVEIWRPLASLAEDIGVDVTNAVTLVSKAVDMRSDTELLLEDIRDIFNEHVGRDFLPTQTLLDELHQREHGGWNEYQGRALTSHILGRMIGRHDIKSRRNPTGTVRGYYRGSFTKAWEHYLPPEDDDLPDDEF